MHVDDMIMFLVMLNTRGVTHNDEEDGVGKDLRGAPHPLGC